MHGSRREQEGNSFPSPPSDYPCTAVIASMPIDSFTLRPRDYCVWKNDVNVGYTGFNATSEA
jgi:hypothetical protein